MKERSIVRIFIKLYFKFSIKIFTWKKNCGESILNTEIKSDESYFYVI